MAHPDSERLQLYLDQGVGEWERQALDSHLASCEVCSEQVRGLRDLLDGLESLTEMSLPPEFAAEVAEEASPSRHLAVSPARRPLLVQATICLIILITSAALLLVVDTPVSDPSDDVLGTIDVLLGSPFQADASIVAVLAIMALAGLGVLACVLAAAPRVRPERHHSAPSRVPRRRR
jgi:hypothetical protein